MEIKFVSIITDIPKDRKFYAGVRIYSKQTPAKGILLKLSSRPFQSDEEVFEFLENYLLTDLMESVFSVLRENKFVEERIN